jgi:hypothetical protein
MTSLYKHFTNSGCESALDLGQRDESECDDSMSIRGTGQPDVVSHDAS